MKCVEYVNLSVSNMQIEMEMESKHIPDFQHHLCSYFVLCHVMHIFKWDGIPQYFSSLYCFFSVTRLAALNSITKNIHFRFGWKI